MHVSRWTIQLGFWIILAIMSGQHTAWAADEIEYRFERMLPKLEQPWYFHSPWGIAIAPDGSIWTADVGKNRIQHLKANGDFIAQYGGYGSAAGKFVLPSSISVAADGSVWVADTLNHRIQHLKDDGSSILALGGEGSAAGKFNQPSGIAIAPDGSVWIADTNNHRIQHFTADGSFIAQFGSNGSAAGQFKEPRGISVAADGSIWVSEAGNNRVQHLKADGTVISAFGSKGSAPGQFNLPNDIRVVADGSVWVADTMNERIQHFNADGSLIGLFGKAGRADGELGNPRSLAMAADGSLWVADAWNNRIQHLKADGSFIAQFSSAGSNEGQFRDPSSMTIAPDGTVWVADTNNSRIQHLKADGSFIAEFNGWDPVAGIFIQPSGIATASDGSVWVADTYNNRLQHLQADGKFITRFGSGGSAAGQFNQPKGVSVASDGSVWVADMQNHRIQHLKADGSFIAQFGSKGSGAAQFFEPSGIALAADSSLWVTDTGNNRIKHLQANGDVITQFGINGAAAGQFARPNGIVAISDGSIWVADQWNQRVQHLNADGSFIEQFGKAGTAPGQFGDVHGIAVAKDGSVWVADHGNHRLQKFVPRAKSSAAHPYKAIILAGGGEQNGGRVNHLWDSTQRVTQKAYKALSLQGFRVHDEIKFLTAGSTQIDLDGNNKFDDLEVATKDSLRRAITEWAADAKDVVIYLADHGGPDKFQINGTEMLGGKELADWVTQLEKAIPGKITLVFESCNAASFFNSLASKTRPRNIIASTKSDQPAVLANNGANSFSYYLWSEVASGANLQTAFKQARQDASSIVVNNAAQQAQADSDGDGIYAEQDLSSFGNYCLGNCNFVTAALPPVLTPPNPNTQTLNGAISLDLNLTVKHLQPLLEVWALVQRPDDISIDPNQPLNFEKVALSCNAQDQCTAKYAKFDLQGQYRLSFYAMDTNYEISTPEVLTVTQTQGRSVLAVDYDDKQTTIYLRDVKVGEVHYQAALQLQNGQFVLTAAGLSPTLFNPPAVFDTGKNLLSIPLARAFGQDYQATLKHLGNYVFELQQAGPK